VGGRRGRVSRPPAERTGWGDRAIRRGQTTLWLLHTNDFHGRLSPERAAALRAVRERHPDALLLDAGDAVAAGNLGFRPGGEPILEQMSALGYHAMTVGNRESHPRKEIFPHKLREARFPILSANLTPRSGAPNPTRPAVVLSVGETQVAVFGLTVPMFTRKLWSQALCDYLFEEPVETARALVPRLREQADLVVALTHIGLQRDQVLAAEVPGIDLIVGGHTHADLEAPVVVNGIPILHTTAYAFYVGCARLERASTAPHTISHARWQLVEWRRPVRRAASESIPGGNRQPVRPTKEG
jgi:2',3'-cyclic-nucleotide 2'-phosphodiesterase (5'-nucleotidase family)